MSIRSDSSVHEDDQEILGGYEDLESDDERGNEAEENDDENGDGDGETEKKKKVDPTTKKQVVRRPMINLNTERLKGPKGICTLEKYFEGFRYYGKGHEKTDLDRIMKRLEHWSHRLFPKLDFDDFLAKTEILGTKKDLKVFVKKYRMDMITSDSDIVPQDDNEDIQEETEPMDAFDELIAEQIEKQKQATRSHENSMLSDSNLETSMQNINDMSSRNINDASSQIINSTVEMRNKRFMETKKSTDSTELSDEIKARIERNRLQAIERRMARLRAMEEESKKKKLEDDKNVESKDESREKNNEQNIQISENTENKNDEKAEHKNEENAEHKNEENAEGENQENTKDENTSSNDTVTEISMDIPQNENANQENSAPIQDMGNTQTNDTV